MTLEDFGYDPHDPVPRDEWGVRVVPDRLIEALADAPIISEMMPNMSRWETNSALTATEIRTLRCVSDGMSFAMIGELLGVSSWTIKDRVRSARYKLQAENTTHACCLALRQGLID